MIHNILIIKSLYSIFGIFQIKNGLFYNKIKKIDQILFKNMLIHANEIHVNTCRWTLHVSTCRWKYTLEYMWYVMVDILYYPPLKFSIAVFLWSHKCHGPAVAPSPDYLHYLCQRDSNICFHHCHKSINII